MLAASTTAIVHTYDGISACKFGLRTPTERQLAVGIASLVLTGGLLKGRRVHGNKTKLLPGRTIVTSKLLSHVVLPWHG